MSNYIKHLKSTLKQNLISIPGWRTKRRIVVIESDDWGSIRMPSKEVYSDFINKGYDISGTAYNRFDALESNYDLELLFEILSSVKDVKGNSPIFTANVVVGNPDFNKIRNSEFEEFYFEPSTVTLQAYPGRERVHSLWLEGERNRLFHPQLHGREHVNITRWMKALKTGATRIMFAFDKRTTFSGIGDYNFMEVLDYNFPEELGKMKQSLVEGLNLFEKMFDFRSKSFTPPCYTWDSDIESILADNGVKYIQGLIVQLIPTGTFGNYKKKYHSLGSKNNNDQIYLVRNCFFEPALSMNHDPVDDCLNRIRIAFKWNKPALICTHRINYIGSLVEDNRSTNLRLLRDLLKKIVECWPETEFITSDDLGNIISQSH